MRLHFKSANLGKLDPWTEILGTYHDLGLVFFGITGLVLVVEVEVTPLTARVSVTGRAGVCAFLGGRIIGVSESEVGIGTHL